ncbi:Mitochondrial import inner membrane translocase subunit Tim8 A [Frankliniella fusca]|uniref:Mitochondrial import inner membrane translocase subunit n=1 Tax=Frankliniella fusca TaxID=407009 RepID=A0AAE1GSF2_9NEOP|nr:Mitochondrial import inner membrane translocase subunit Tim8 A [Frankliniella fusca]
MNDMYGSSSDSKLGDDANKEKIQEELQQLTALSELQAQVVEFTDICWDKCMGTPGSKLDSKTQTCMQNCVERFLDVTMFVTNRFAQIVEKNQSMR